MNQGKHYSEPMTAIIVSSPVRLRFPRRLKKHCSFSTRTPHRVWKAQDRSRGTAGRKHLEGSQDELALHRFVPRQSERQAKGKKGQPDRARRTHLFRRGRQQQVEANCADACLLNRTCDQSHGLITERSNRNEDRRVHLLRTKVQRDLGRGSLDQRLRVRDVAHEAIMLGCQRADDAFLLKLLPNAQGK